MLGNSMPLPPLQGCRFNSSVVKMKIPHAAWCGPKQNTPPYLLWYLHLLSDHEWNLPKRCDSCFKVCTGSTMSSVGKLESFHLKLPSNFLERCSRTNLFLPLININCSSCWGLQMDWHFRFSSWAEPPKKWSSSEGTRFFFKCSNKYKCVSFLM